MLKTALCFADDSNNSNLNTIIAQVAYRKSKALCHQLAMDDPTSILRGIASLPIADQISLAYLRSKAMEMIETSRRNNPKTR
ncbi:MAG: hypothetical protein ACHQYP_12570 [Nitrospiria bacterium]